MGEDPVKLIAEFAAMLETPAFLDETSPAMRRGFRDASDKLKEAIEAWGQELTAPMLMVFYSGAVAQKSAERAAMAASPLEPLMKVLGGQSATSKVDTPHVSLTIMLAYLSRDLLTGERVE